MDGCVVCSKSELIPNLLTCGHVICKICIKRDMLNDCKVCHQPINVKFSFEMPMTESPTLVKITSEDGVSTYATILLHGGQYNKFLAYQRKNGRGVDSCETRLEFDQFLKWQQERRLLDKFAK